MAEPLAPLDRDTILRTLEAHRRELRKLGVRRIGLFGSYLHDQAQPESDVDLLVDLERSSFDAYMDTKLLLEDLFHRKVDLVTEKALKPALRRIRNEAAYASGF